MFDLINLPEEEEFIRSALIGNVIRLSMVMVYTQYNNYFYRILKELMSFKK